MNFSLEIGPQTDLETVPSVSDVYITMLPGGDYKETAEKAIELVKKGFNPVPHFPARSMQDELELKDYVLRCKDGGVKKALVIGGGAIGLLSGLILSKVKNCKEIVIVDPNEKRLGECSKYLDATAAKPESKSIVNDSFDIVFDTSALAV